MSKVIYDHAPTQAEREAEERQQKITQLLTAMGIEYGEQKLSDTQRAVLELLVKIHRSKDDAVRTLIGTPLDFAYGYAVLYMQIPTMGPLTPWIAANAITQLGETSEPYREMTSWTQFLGDLMIRSGLTTNEVIDARIPEIQSLMRELNLSDNEQYALWYEDILAHC